MKENRITTYDLSGESFFGKRKALLKLFAEGGYDAVVVHHEGVKLYLLYEALIRRAERAKMLDVTFIKYLHCAFDKGVLFTGKKIEDTLHHFLLGKTLEDSDCVVAVSEFAKKSYIDEFGIEEDKISVIYNGIEVNKDSYRRKYLDRSRLLYIGRLVDVKGVDILIKAIALLHDKGNDVILDVLGDGDARVSLQELSNSLGIADQINFQGVVLEKNEYYARDGIFVYPSVCNEAFGISVIEAMNYGLVCVASRIGGIPEIVTDDKYGILVEAGNPQNLANAIEEAQRRCQEEIYPEYRDLIVGRAEEFEIEKSVAKLEMLIEKD